MEYDTVASASVNIALNQLKPDTFVDFVRVGDIKSLSCFARVVQA